MKVIKNWKLRYAEFKSYIKPILEKEFPEDHICNGKYDGLYVESKERYFDGYQLIFDISPESGAFLNHIEKYDIVLQREAEKMKFDLYIQDW